VSTILLDMSVHIPVLAGELIDLLDLRPGQTAVDCTFGGGGHARLLARRLGASGTLVAIDRDPVAEERFAELADEVACSVRFIRGGYAEALALLAQEGLRADSVHFDLGMSSMQVDTRERGFSYSYDAPLDMRMDPAQELDARAILATWEERRIAATLRELGEERRAGTIARAIVRRRERDGAIETTQELVETVASAIPAPARFAGGHPAKRVFQALRIAVNDELGQLDRALPLAWELLRGGGVLAAISFHSLEDRRVKRFMAERARGCVCPPDLPVCACGRVPEATLLTRRAVVPSAGELAHNPRAASARLRAARKLEGGESGAGDAAYMGDAASAGNGVGAGDVTAGEGGVAGAGNASGGYERLLRRAGAGSVAGGAGGGV
jgi:16S rRNA (cytosine1402-N4)-methyltransferase